MRVVTVLVVPVFVVEVAVTVVSVPVAVVLDVVQPRPHICWHCVLAYASSSPVTVQSERAIRVPQPTDSVTPLHVCRLYLGVVVVVVEVVGTQLPHMVGHSFRAISPTAPCSSLHAEIWTSRPQNSFSGIPLQTPGVYVVVVRVVEVAVVVVEVPVAVVLVAVAVVAVAVVLVAVVVVRVTVVLVAVVLVAVAVEVVVAVAVVVLVAVSVVVLAVEVVAVVDVAVVAVPVDVVVTDVLVAVVVVVVVVVHPTSSLPSLQSLKPLHVYRFKMQSFRSAQINTFPTHPASRSLVVVVAVVAQPASSLPSAQSAMPLQTRMWRGGG